MAKTTLVFGDSGAYKTTNMGLAALYEYERTGGKKVRAVYSDGGGWEPIQSYVNAGIVEPYYIKDEANMPVLLHKLARGWWPEKLDQGIRAKGTKLLPPVPGTWATVGAYLWEGLTSSSELLMKYLRDKQIAIAGDPVGKFEIREQNDATGQQETYLFCANNMKHYDWVQNEVLAILGEFSALPVDRVLITAHEAAGEEEGTGRAIRGPGLAGKAGTYKVARNVGDCIHAEVYVKSEVKDGIGVLTSEVRMFFQSHPDMTHPKVFYSCKPRVEAREVGKLLETFPGGYFVPKPSAGLDTYLRVIDQLSASEEVAKQKLEIDARLKKGVGAQ